MSGHSKWATIKHKKAAWTPSAARYSRASSRKLRSPPDPAATRTVTPWLRTAITAAKAVSMPADNITRAIKRGTGELAGTQIDEIMYEGYGPGGAAVMVEVATDNRNRTVSEIRHAFSKHGGNMGEQGSVGWMFKRKSRILIDEELVNEEQLMNLALEAGADDIQNEGGQWVVLSAPENHVAVLEAIQKAKIETLEAGVAMVPENLIKLEGSQARGMLKLTDVLDNHDDVQNVYSNFDIDEEELAAMEQ